LKNKLKVALVKQVVLPDLYVCDLNESIDQILFSSIMRVGPLGLFQEFNCDFYIVNIENAKECNIWQELNKTPLNGSSNLLLELITKPINQISGQEFKEPGTSIPNGHFMRNVSEINWEIYDIVISINLSIPSQLVKKYRNILWCYMLIEPDNYLKTVNWGYDVCLNHNISGNTFYRPGVIDFPYTLLPPDLLNRIMYNELKRNSLRDGLFLDISCSKEQRCEMKVTELPKRLNLLKALNQRIILHSQNIKQNLMGLFDSKYFVKIGGSYIRGNSLIEAISAGTLVIANPDEISFKVLLPKECQVVNIEETCKLIAYLETNPEKYKELVYKQKALCQFVVVDKPLESIQNILYFKRKYGYYNRTFYNKLKFRLKNSLFKN
jgi:hypothetical protein